MTQQHQRSDVLCRYFFQGTLVEDGSAPLEHYTSSLLLSSEPTLEELRRRFPFEGEYHFRLQHPLPAPPSGKPSYCWLDLREPHHVLPVMRAPHSEIRVKVLQLSPESINPAAATTAPHKRQAPLQHTHDDVDVPEDQRYDAFFHAHRHQQQQQTQPFHDASSSVLSGVKKALASKVKQSTSIAQSLQKQSAKMWDKVVANASGVASTTNANTTASAPPSAAALAQLAKLISAMKTPLHETNRDHVELLHRLWRATIESETHEPFVVRGAGSSSSWHLVGFHNDPLRELPNALPLRCLVFFCEAHSSVARPMLATQLYAIAPIAVQLTQLLADELQLRDGACLGLARPFWRLFEDPSAFFEVFSVALRAFDASWRFAMAENQTNQQHTQQHLDYVADFVRELLQMQSPSTVPALVECAQQMQSW